MKKTIIALSIICASVAASAVDVGVSAVRDHSLEQTGLRVEGSVGEVYGLKPVISYTAIRDNYERYALGVQYTPFTLNGFSASAVGSGVYQVTSNGENGYGWSVGTKVTYDVSKDVQLFAGFERLIGQSRIKDGNLSSFGAVIKF